MCVRVLPIACTVGSPSTVPSFRPAAALAITIYCDAVANGAVRPSEFIVPFIQNFTPESRSLSPPSTIFFCLTAVVLLAAPFPDACCALRFTPACSLSLAGSCVVDAFSVICNAVLESALGHVDHFLKNRDFRRSKMNDKRSTCVGPLGLAVTKGCHHALSAFIYGLSNVIPRQS